MKIIYQLKWFYAVTFSILLFVSCDPLKIFGSSNLFSTYSLIPTEGLSTSHIPNEKFFYVNLYASYYTGEGFDPLDAIIYAMDQGPGTNCKIPVERDSTEDLYCIMDVMEGDLWLHKIVLEYNVPEGMCDYLKFDVPWHFNQRVGEGPEDVYVCNDYFTGCSDGEEPIPEVETRYCLGGCSKENQPSCRGENLVTMSCDGIEGSATTEKETAQDFCSELDQSQNKLSNCCMGEYTLHSKDNETEVEWGGDYKGCIGGLGRLSWSEYNHEGLPKSVITPTLKNGYKNTYEIPALIEVFDGTKQPSLNRPSFISANYWTDVEKKDFSSTGPKFYRAPTPAQLPQPSYMRSVNISGYPYLSWACMDKAEDVKHRIRVIFKEWNTQEEYNSFKETKGSRGDPDVAGQEGSVCEYYEAEEALLKDTACNDAMDVDDWQIEDHGIGRNYNPYPEVIYK